MHILFVTPVVPSPSYGRRPYNFIRYLSRENRVYLATFITRPEDDMKALRELASWGVVARTVPHPLWKSLLNCAVGLPTLKPLRALWIRSGPLQNLIREMLEKYPIELAHFDRMRMAYHALGITGIPRLADFTDAMMLYLDRTRTPYRSLGGRLIDIWERRTIPAFEELLLKSMEAVICCSPVDQAVFHKYHPNYQVEVVPNSVDCEHFQPRHRPEGEPPRLVFTGTFSYFPNLDSLFYFMDHIWQDIRTQIPDIRLEIIGARPPTQVLRLAAQPGIRILPDVPDMADYLYQNDIFICPLRVAAGVRNKILEAMACGMTTISTTLGVEGLSVEPGKHFLQANTPQEFMDSVIKAVNSSGLRKKIGEQARQYALENHSSEVSGRMLMEIYQRIGDRL